jgi:hypothetical protein
VVAAVGAGFLINDAVLIPLYVALLTVNRPGVRRCLSF